jgi:hypothetical protein
MVGSTYSSTDYQNFFRGVVAELQRVVERDRAAWTIKTHLPVVPHAAQLSLLGLLLLQGMAPECMEVFPHRDRLEDLLGKAYRKAKDAWGESLFKTKPEARDRVLNDDKILQPTVMKAVRFCERNFGLMDFSPEMFLRNSSVQDTLAEMTGTIADLVGKKLSDSKGQLLPDVPSAVSGALAVASLAGGLAGRRVMSAKEASAARCIARLGSKKDATGGPEPKEVRRLRKTLKELAAQLPEQ